MGSFVFTWDHPATEVFVTGTFDDWSKSVKLEKKEGTLHSKEVTLSNADEKIYYKFVVDGNWTTDHTAPTETDNSGNTNNVLTPERITKGDVGSSDLPGAFPETPAAGVQEVSVNPLPATAGIGNPISTTPGEKLPPTGDITTSDINSHVTLDKESYEKSGSGAPQLPDVVTPEKERSESTGLFGLPEQSKNTIPESSLPITGGAPVNTFQSSGAGTTTAALAGEVPLEPRPETANIQSSGAGTTTAALAGEVPKEPRGVPEVVQDSQEEAKAAPEASANPEAVAEKSAVESELQKVVPEEPPASESTISGKAAALVGGAVAATGAAAAGATAYIQSGKATEDVKESVPEAVKEKLPEANAGTSSVTDKVPSAAAVTEKLPEPVKDAVASNGTTTGPTPIASTVPDPVQESIAKAHEAPEAAASPTAVEEKSAVESELLKKVPAEQSAGEPAPEAAATAATSATAPAASLKSTAVPLSDTKPETTSKSTAAPIDATESTEKGKATETTPAPETKTEDREPRPSAMASALSESKKNEPDSRDISPMTRPDGSKPTVTTGVGSSSTPSKSTAAAPASPASNKTGETDKKSKRRSGFFDKLKNAVHRHKKDEAK